ncbi:hypothetical protein BCR35DRAFT_185327 [Leucosporidium creatinivorum]|uniref:Uncharacterized protein n=1 Tax=Leucosporidium creatinivorum TaxID=106004 RepID=A0A1Y2DZS2_9BASI|nr:hypothetical protein BCR35DRAFT_185327 [Leucosporidium creatinivorum]
MATTASSEQELLFALRSPTTPLNDKLALAHSALVLSPNSQLLPQLIRDWLLDNLLRARQNQDVLLSQPLWSLFAQVQLSSQATTTSSSLPVFVAFLSAYSALPAPNNDLVQAVATVWSRLAAGAMRKATVDAALEGYATLLKASVVVLSRQGDDVAAWEGLAEVWLKAFRSVVDSGKGGKKIPQHTLANLSSLLPLLSLISPTSSLRVSVLSTVQFALFNLDNLRRGIARESYNVGVAPSAADDTEGAAGELLGALKSHLAAHPESASHVLASIPLLTSLYFTSLASHSSTLFPLPAKTTFPTASAARSAGEIHSLQKRRALAAGWVRGVAALIGWRKEVGAMEVDDVQEEEEQKATSLALTLAEVESGDLHREGRNEGWEGILESLVEGSLSRLGASPSTPTREAVTLVLGTILRLSFASTDAYIPQILASLASTPSPSISTPSPSASLLLTSLLTHHTRSLTLPTLLLQVSTALAAPTSMPNSLLTAHSFLAALERALSGLVGLVSVRNCWDALIKALVEELPSLKPSPAAEGEGEEEATPEPSKKRRKVDSSSEGSEAGASARLRLLALYARSLPAPLPLAQFDAFATDFLTPALKSLGKSARKWKSSAKGARGVEMEILGVGYECRERIWSAGNWEERREEWSVGGKRCAELRGILEIEEGKAEAEVVVVAAQTLLQALELGSPAAIEDAQPILGAILNLITRSSDDVPSWDGHLRGLSLASLPVATWELISRRWLPVFERYASAEQLKQIAELIVGSMTNGIAKEEGITIDGITARLLRRADVYELRSLQGEPSASLDPRSLANPPPPRSKHNCTPSSSPASQSPPSPPPPKSSRTSPPAKLPNPCVPCLPRPSSPPSRLLSAFPLSCLWSMSERR